MRRQLQVLVLGGTLILFAGCASAEKRGASDRSDPDLITRVEIDRGQWRDSYALVRQLRPQWLRTRGTDSFSAPGAVQVYVDGTRLGGVELLRTLPTTGIDQLEWIDPVDAAGRWGLNHAHGVISITYSPDQAPARN